MRNVAANTEYYALRGKTPRPGERIPLSYSMLGSRMAEHGKGTLTGTMRAVSYEIAGNTIRVILGIKLKTRHNMNELTVTRAEFAELVPAIFQRDNLPVNAPSDVCWTEFGRALERGQTERVPTRPYEHRISPSMGVLHQYQ